MNEQDYRETFIKYCVALGLDMPTAYTCGPLYCSGYIRGNFSPRAENFTAVRQISSHVFYVSLAAPHYNDEAKTKGLFKLPETVTP